MDTNTLFKIFPETCIQAEDGLTITAEIWQQAHSYHHRFQTFQGLLHHSWGIVTGLEVFASNPPDTSVYIQPGVAVDSQGRTIVLSQPVAYDIGTDMEGLIYLYLSYDESQPRSTQLDEDAGEPRLVRAEFSIAAQTALNDKPAVELARIQRRDRQDSFLNPVHPLQPDANEIDRRFRPEISTLREASMAVCYLGDPAGLKQGKGAYYLANTLKHLGHYRLTVHDDAPLGPGVENNTLIYLVGRGRFELNQDQIEGLGNYVRRGQGTIFLEAYDSAAENQLLQLLRRLDLEPANIATNNPLLYEPHFFLKPPPGYNIDSSSKVLAAEGVVYSARNYGLVWQGETSKGEPSRELIRSAVEWGTNIIAYAIQRRTQGSS